MKAFHKFLKCTGREGLLLYLPVLQFLIFIRDLCISIYVYKSRVKCSMVLSYVDLDATLIVSFDFLPLETIFWCIHILFLSWQLSLSYSNQSIDLLCKSMDWFLYDIYLRHERVKTNCEILSSAPSIFRKELIVNHYN